MANADLQGRVGLDINPFLAGLRRLRGTAEPAGAFIGKQFRSGFLKFFGAGAMIATAQKSLSGAADIMRESARLKTDVETYQALQYIAERYGYTVDELSEKILNNANASSVMKDQLKAMVAEVKDLGIVIDAGTIERLAQIFFLMQKWFAKLAPLVAFVLDKSLKLVNLFERLGKLVAGFGLFVGGEFFEREDWKKRGVEMGKSAIEGMETDFKSFWKNFWKTEKAPPHPTQRPFELPETKTRETERRNLFRPEMDALQRRGIYLLGSPAMVRQAEQTLHLKNIEKRLIEIKTTITGQLSA